MLYFRVQGAVGSSSMGPVSVSGETGGGDAVKSSSSFPSIRRLVIAAMQVAPVFFVRRKLKQMDLLNSSLDRYCLNRFKREEKKLKIF